MIVRQLGRSELGHSRRGRGNGKSGHVRYARKAEVNHGARVDVIQASKLEHRIMRDEFSECEWTASGRWCQQAAWRRRANDRRVLNGTFWVQLQVRHGASLASGTRTYWRRKRS